MVLAIYGAGGLGREIHELARIVDERESRWNKCIFIVDGDAPDTICDCKVYGYEQAKELYGNDLEIVMGIGEPATRMTLLSKIKADGISTPTIIHPDVHIPTSTIVGKGVVIQVGCYISVGVTIKDYVLLQPQCAVGHDCILEEGSVISTFDSIAGAARIGKSTYIGMSVAVKELVSIGDYSIIGMGSVVFKDVPDEVIAIGNPARVMKKNEERHVFKH